MTRPSVERREIERIAQEYRERGYKVLIEPVRDDVPHFLKGTSPDILASFGNEMVVIEVKVTSQLPRAQDVAEFAKRIDAQPGWRLELVTVEPESGSGSFEYPRRWQAVDIRARLDEARLSMNAGHFRAALLLAYAVTEAAAFACFEGIWVKNEPATPPRTTRALIRQMVVEGVIDRQQFVEFQRVEGLRNALAHGVVGKDVERSDVESLIQLATDFLAKLLGSGLPETPIHSQNVDDNAEQLATLTLLKTFDWTRLRRDVFRITKDLAGVDDVVQVVRRRVGQMSAAQWRGISNRNKYIHYMARNQAMAWLAEEKRQREAAKRLKEATVPDHDSGDLATRVFAGRDVLRLLQRIGQPRVREALILRKVDKLSTQEVAQIMGISEATVKEYLIKAAEQLATLRGHHKSRRKRAHPTGSARRKKKH